MALIFTDSFWNENGRSLKKPDIACLRQDADTYDTLLLQLKDKIEYDTNGIWIADKERALSKFINFIELAIEHDVELAVTPEYSCPWQAIDELIQENKFPQLHNLWVLGCQSIRTKELRNFIDTHNQVTWIVDENLLNNSLKTPEKFFDPVCIIFSTYNTAGDVIKLIIVQFKTMYFGGQDYIWERDNFIKGSTFFVISNQFASTKLLVLLCSDALQNLDLNIVGEGFFLNDPLLLLHIQLNQKPFKLNYKTYRNLLFQSGDKNYKKEAICLNWARGVETKDKDPWNEYGGSGFYIKSDKLDLSDIRINENQSLGLYYTRWDDRRSHIYFLNYDEYVFLVTNTKPSQDVADPTQFKRTGPKVKRIYEWDENWETVNKANNGFIDLCSTLENEIGDISCIKDSDRFIEVERIVELSLGNLVWDKNWHEPSVLKPLLIKDDEINNRLNFAQDPTQEIQEIREKKLINYAYLKHTVLTNPANLPDTLKAVELKYDQSIQVPERFLLNLHSTKDQHKGTGVFLSVSRPKAAIAMREAIESLFIESQQRRKVVVWYLHNGRLEKEIDDHTKPGINENLEKPAPSYKRTKE